MANTEAPERAPVVKAGNQANKESNSSKEDKDVAATKECLDQSFTAKVIAATGPGADPRIRQIMASLIQHVHDFARENAVTMEEWAAGIEMINDAGRMSTSSRNEGQMLCDVIGLESLVDSITFSLITNAPDQPTSSAILGPFWRRGAPKRAMGASIVDGFEDGDHTYVHGRVLDHVTGKPVKGAELDVWHTAPNGLYEQQDQDQPDMNLRGRFVTGKDGRYNFYCLRPTSYPIPNDGPAGKLLQLLDRHPFRPAHIHFIVSAPGYKPVVTQIFDRRDNHIHDDAVFAVKQSLIVDFLPRQDDAKARLELPYDFKLASFASPQGQSVAGSTPDSATLGAEPK